MNETRKALYDQWREEFEDSPAKIVGWRNQESLDKRFHVTLSKLFNPLTSSKILDVGCGAALNLLKYLPIPVGNDSEEFQYLGIDCNRKSLEYAHSTHSFVELVDKPIEDRYELYQIYEDEFLDKTLNSIYGESGFDIIICQGIHQEFDSINSVREHIAKLCSMLSPDGEIIVLTPINRLLDADGKSVLKLSAYDAVSIAEYTQLKYDISVGELGEHIILHMWR